MDPKRIEWLQDWDRNIGPERQRTYVGAELQKLQEQGLPLLYAIVTRPFHEQQDVALSVLADMGVTSVMLRLVAGAKPPLHDAQGRPLPEALQGKVFRTKVRQFGNTVNGQVPDPIASKKFTGPLRNDLAKSDKGLYVHADITHRPTPVSIEDAVVIMRQYGHGVSGEQWRRRKSAEARRIDLWLVEEVTQAMLDDEATRPTAATAAPSKPASKSAAA